MEEKKLPEYYNPDEALRLENQLCFPLYACARMVVGQYTPYLKPLGITYTQYLVFLLLWAEDGRSVGDLCGRLYLDSGTLTPMLKKMEEKHLVERRRCRDDERVVRIWLTEEGRKLKEKAAAIPLQVGACIKITPEEASTLYTLLYRTMEQI
ncbi:MAG: MarR family transcriptional regulator [Solobacterium sp.]|nr:MarR family transcriptional regulator [Solobacterium sp.]MBQ6356765.1 MarR family transcriptional regulator [Solobacterium sp.]MBQ6531772.1 MarR family transcriptional regulator [Solobacterium sp.]MBR0213269.1 MarR family transcriptional regulator [Solobacterium sp.]